MNNFGTLLLYELRKILQNRFTLIAMAFMLFITLTDGGVFDWDRIQDRIKDAEMEIDGRILDDALLADMVANSDEYGVAFRSRENTIYAGLIDFVRKVMDFGRPLASYTSEEIYQTRLENNRIRMQQFRLSEKEISYWQEKEAQIRKPFQWSYTTPSNYLVQGFYSQGILCLFLAAIALSGMFSGERRNRTGQMIFVTRNGKKTTYYAKLVAGCLFLLSATLFFTIIFVFINAMKRGTEGFHAQVQLFLPQISEAMTMGQAAVIMAVILIAASLFLAITAMVLSELFHNSLAVMGAMLGFFSLAMTSLDQIPEKYRLLSQLVQMVPTNMLTPGGLCDYRLFGVQGHYLTEYQFAPILYVCLAMILLGIGKASYLKGERYR